MFPVLLNLVAFRSPIKIGIQQKSPAEKSAGLSFSLINSFNPPQ